MTKSEYVKCTVAKVKGFVAHVNDDILNNGGQEIAKGELVTILNKYGGFHIRSFAGIDITRVNYKYIDIIGITKLDIQE